MCPPHPVDEPRDGQIGVAREPPETTQKKREPEMRVSDRFQIVFGALFWGVIVVICFAAQDGCNHRPRSENRHHVSISWQGENGETKVIRTSVPSSEIPSPANAREYAQVANDFYQRKEFDEAVHCQSRAVQADPEDARHQYNLACYLARRDRPGDRLESLDTLKTAVELNPYYGSYALTDRDFRGFRKTDEFKRIAYLSAARYAASRRDYHTALKHFLELQELEFAFHDELDTEVLYAMTKSAIGARKYDLALDWFEKAVERDPEVSRQAIKDPSLKPLKEMERFYEIVAPAFSSELFSGQHGLAEAEPECGSQDRSLTSQPAKARSRCSEKSEAADDY